MGHPVDHHQVIDSRNNDDIIKYLEQYSTHFQVRKGSQTIGTYGTHFCRIKKIPSKLEVAPNALKMLDGVGEWMDGYPLDCYDY